MKTKLSKQISQYNIQKSQIVDFANKKKYSVDDITEFSAICGIPLYFMYYYYWKELNIEDAEKQLMRILEFYDIEYDL